MFPECTLSVPPRMRRRIITPYRAQMAVLKARVRWPPDLEVNTVDGFQGREKDVVFFSAVRANAAGSIGFLADSRRLNVAATRAKYSLFVVGELL